eukprot:NODE_977_length_1282_cov_527.972290.p1 GENE.NODE_977_length_1282_cov_527.972290~~NODE_977_length_1282_cov_527.972290.p1  ORF type:complete len:379 (-),score=53.29 NODE_977_length_1282_cov_527.972290:128-1264(-)
MGLKQRFSLQPFGFAAQTWSRAYLPAGMIAQQQQRIASPQFYTSAGPVSASAPTTFGRGITVARSPTATAVPAVTLASVPFAAPTGAPLPVARGGAVVWGSSMPPVPRAVPQLAGPPWPTVGSPAAATTGRVVSSSTVSYTNPKCLSTQHTFDGDYRIDGRPLRLIVDPINSDRACHVTGLRVWDGGLVLSKYLESYVPEVAQRMPGKRLRALDLGCGSGVAGLSVGLMGHDAILSDIAGVQADATQLNITQNQPELDKAGGTVVFEVIDWRSLPCDRERFGYLDLVFAADVIWHESFVAPFVAALGWAASGPGAGEVLLAHKTRDTESIEMFERLASEGGWVVKQKVDSIAAIGEDGHPLVKVYHIDRFASVSAPGS